jgi:hypothetical protein
MIDCSFFGCTWCGFKIAQVQDLFLINGFIDEQLGHLLFKPNE